MLINWIAALPLLAATDEPTLIVSLLTNIMLWGRVALGIGLVIFVHELGHFVAAKSFGVKCEKFYVGFDVPIRIGPIKFPRTLGKFTYGETEYGIGIIPLGGYVKMLGQDDDPRKLEEENKRIQVPGEENLDDFDAPKLDPRSFPAKPVWQRMIIISSGVVVNVITGVIFAAIAYGYGVSYSPAVVGGVVAGGPAWQAGIEPGGQVVTVGTWHDEQMHFREMRTEVLTEGLDNPDQPLQVSVRYGDEVRDYVMQSQSRPEMKDARMIGLSIPNTVTLDKDNPAVPDTVAASVLTDADGGATIVAFDGTAIDQAAFIPGTPFFDHLYSNPTKTIQLQLQRTDKSLHTVDLPPQKSNFIGVRFAVGPIVALVKDGPAEKAGVKVGDVIKKVGTDASLDAYGLSLALVNAKETLNITVERIVDGEAKQVELQITPENALQTLPPTRGITGEIGLNRAGFAFQPLPTVAEFIPADPAAPDATTLVPGDQIKEVQLVLKGDKKPEWLLDERFADLFKELQAGWEFSSVTPLTTFCDTLQVLPIGTELRVKAARGSDGRIIESTVTVRVDADDRVMFERGLMLLPSESIQRAGSISEALALGLKEGKRRFWDVIRFLKMLPSGRIKLRHVGGPLEIVNIAKTETEKGISPQLMFLTMLSMNLAILNFLPIPALDGGHMMFLLYELVFGKRANEQLEFRLTVAGLLSLLILMAVVFANDILRHI